MHFKSPQRGNPQVPSFLSQLLAAVVLFAATSYALTGIQNRKPSIETAVSPAQYLYGTWYFYPPGNAQLDPIRHEFRHNAATDKDEVIITRLCPGNYRAAIAKAVSPVEITASTIRVLKSSTAVEKGELNTECKATVERGLWSYTISDDHNRLTITDPGGTPDIMELARQEASSSAQLPSNIYGTWSLPVQDNGDTHVQIRLIFYSSADPSKGTVRQIATCMKGNDTLTSQVDSDIRVTADHVSILNSASHVQRSGPFTCTVNFTPGTLQYSVSATGTTMTLTPAGGPPIRLTRERESGLN